MDDVEARRRESVTWPVWRSEDSFAKSLLSGHLYMGSAEQSQMVRLSGQEPCPESQLAEPLACLL